MYDLALSDKGDLIFSGNRDFAGVSGTDLIEQRMRLRMKVKRGTWVYDDTQTLGSQFYTLIGQSADQIHTQIETLAREALRPMADIIIDSVDHMHVGIDGNETEMHDEGTVSVIVIVNYHIVDGPTEELTNDPRQFDFTLPVAGG